MPRDRRRPQPAHRGRQRTVRPGDRRRAPTRAAQRATPSPAPAGAFRRGVERRSLALLAVLHAQPRWVPFLLVVGLLLVGLAVEGPLGTVALLTLLALLAWLLYLSWPVLDRRARALRAGVLGALVGVMIGRFFL